MFNEGRQYNGSRYIEESSVIQTDWDPESTRDDPVMVLERDYADDGGIEFTEEVENAIDYFFDD
jgi:hypothetical protein